MVKDDSPNASESEHHEAAVDVISANPPRTPDDPPLVDFLRRNHRAFLFCRDDEGRPIGYPMRSITYEPGRLYFTAYTKSAKVRHLITNPEAACVVLGGDHAAEGGPWASLHGRAEVYRPSPAEVEAMLDHGSPELRVAESMIADVHDRLLSGKRSFIRLDVDDVLVFDVGRPAAGGRTAEWEPA
jgi:uncharacterized pyridoxamine 5'-phosphate oxidase family protein